MGLFGNIFKKKEIETFEVKVDDQAIVAIANGEMFDITKVKDELFSSKAMGDGVAFKFNEDKVILCSPANGKLSVLFPTGHAFGITTHEGIEILVHCGINTVESNGEGFKVLSKKQGDSILAGEAIVEVDIKTLSSKYDMSTMVIITNSKNRCIKFREAGYFTKGDLIIK